MHTNTELALLNNKNWLLPSPDREFQKSVAETSPFRPQRKKKKPTKPVNSSFVSIFPLFKFNRPRRFARQIIEHSVHSSDFIDNPAHHLLENFKRNFRTLGRHEVHGPDCP